MHASGADMCLTFREEVLDLCGDGGALVCPGLCSCSWRSEQTHTGRSQHFVALIPSRTSLSQHPTCMRHSGKMSPSPPASNSFPPELTVLLRRLSIKNLQRTQNLHTYGPRQEVCRRRRCCHRAFYSAPNCPTSSGEVTTALSVWKQLVHVAETSASPSFSHQPQTNE